MLGIYQEPNKTFWPVVFGAAAPCGEDAIVPPLPEPDAAAAAARAAAPASCTVAFAMVGGAGGGGGAAGAFGVENSMAM